MNPEIAAIYQDFFPNDNVIVGDAHEYLLQHFKEFDFIWSSPPCPTHSKMQITYVNSEAPQNKSRHALYPDMTLYQEIILLQTFFTKKYCIENVKPYYEPLIKAQECGRHLFWSNFYLSEHKGQAVNIKANIKYHQELYGFNLDKYTIKKVDKSARKDKILRNCVDPKLGLHIYDCAFKNIQLSMI